MIKWFCDVCGKEIEAPEHPTYIKVYMTRKNREDVDSGWGESDECITKCAHVRCSSALVDAIQVLIEKNTRKVTT